MKADAASICHSDSHLSCQLLDTSLMEGRTLHICCCATSVQRATVCVCVIKDLDNYHKNINNGDKLRRNLGWNQPIRIQQRAEVIDVWCRNKTERNTQVDVQQIFLMYIFKFNLWFLFMNESIFYSFFSFTPATLLILRIFFCCVQCETLDMTLLNKLILDPVSQQKRSATTH